MLEGVTDAQGPERTKLIRAFGPQGLEAVGLYHFRCEGTPALAGLSDRHTVILNRSSFVGIACKIGQQSLNHTAMAGNLTLIPAGVEWTATANGTLDNVIVSIPRTSFAAAAARADRPSLTIAPQINGHDDLLWTIVNEMVVTPAELDVRWHGLSNELLDHLTESYGVGVGNKRGILTGAEIRRINAYLLPRLERTVAIDELAEVVAQSASHFPRVFRRTVGLSPHQYVVRLRLRRAREMINAGSPLADAAVDCGFVDQSHLSYWGRRLYGTSPGLWARPA